MKKILKRILAITLFCGVFVSCVNDEDTDIPTLRVAFFSEGFESIQNTGNNQFIALEGWSNVSVNGGSELWEARFFSSDGKYAQMSAFGTGEANVNTWLITPAINLDETENEALRFSYKAAFYNGQAVSVWISEDYDGSNTASGINNATWTNLNVSLPDYATSGYPNRFSLSDIIDLSDYNGNVHIAFRYVGGSSGVSTTYQIDNIKVFENN
ncbi:choice-of-anchor J domain-containing protein [Flavobacterium sp.]|uniref:choice-of-anchor J domain-containing protein n=1 Tax=Flavobacterium sp. TaxID=239 RepID=UPI002FDD6E74